MCCRVIQGTKIREIGIPIKSNDMTSNHIFCITVSLITSSLVQDFKISKGVVKTDLGLDLI